MATTLFVDGDRDRALRALQDAGFELVRENRDGSARLTEADD